MNNKLATRD